MVMPMDYYAFLNSDNIVTEVIPGKTENEDGVNWEEWYAQFKGQACKRTCADTLGGTNIAGGIPFRKNFAGIGYTYDVQRDAFIPPKPFASWILDEDTCQWNSPVPMPSDGQLYAWNETNSAWEKV